MGEGPKNKFNESRNRGFDEWKVIMALKTDKLTFLNDIEFCPMCAAILPLPGKTPFIKCYMCPFKVPIEDFDGLEIKSKIIFNTKQVKSAGLTSEDMAAGPTVDRQCSRCGNDGMTYATRQTRSADEGQTVFYSCPKCNFQETEYS